MARLHFSIVKKTIVSESIAEKPNSNAPPSGGSSSTTLALDFNPQSASATSSALIDAPTSNSASSSAPPTAQYSSGSTVAVANAAANRTAKIRRVMMAARRPGGIGGRAPR